MDCGTALEILNGKFLFNTEEGERKKRRSGVMAVMLSDQSKA